jgi:deoxyribonuclease-4
MPKTIERGVDLGCEALQVFVKSPSQWRARPIADEQVESFRALHRQGPIGTVVAHAAYLINLASPDDEKAALSRAALADELDRCERLGIDGLVLHPGAHVGRGEEEALAAISAGLDEVLAPRAGYRVRVLLENTAGQGTLVGYRLEHLRTIRDATANPERIGVCIDTCHAFAAGYPLHEEGGYEAFWSEFGSLFHLAELGCLHLNDSKHPFDSNRDRHDNIGQGHLGREPFERLVNDPVLAEIPMIVETPLGDDDQGHRRDLDLLRSLRVG